MPKNIESKKHVAHLEQVRRQTQAIKIGAMVVIGIVLSLVLYAVVIEPAIQPYRAVANVNGEAVTVGKFQAHAKMQRLQLLSQYQQYLQYAQMFGIQDITTDQNFGPAVRQIMDQLQPLTLGEDVLDAVIDDKLIRQEAKKRNIVVSPEDVEAAIQEGAGYYPKGSPTPSQTVPPVVATSTPNATQVALISPTPLPTQTESPTRTATLLPSITLTATTTSAPTSTAAPTFTPEPTATPLTLEGYQEKVKEQLDTLDQIKLSESDFRNYYESIVYRRKLQEQVIAGLQPIQEQVWARHILVATEDEAKKVIERLNNGEDFGKLAAELSTDGSAQSGGDLGWFGKGAMVAEFQDVAFTLEIGEFSQPIKSEFGYHIIQVLGHEDRALDGAGFDLYKEQAFTEFLKGLRNAATIEKYDLWKDVVPTEPSLQTGQR